MREAIERFAANGRMHTFRLLDGTVCQGWLRDIGEDGFRLLWLPDTVPPIPSVVGAEGLPETWVRFADVDRGSLAFWDDAKFALTRRGWSRFVVAAEPGAAADRGLIGGS